MTRLTRPRRFGKTLLLSIMQHFFDIKDAEKNRKFFGGLKVAEDARAMAEQGKRPVIFLTLKDWEAGSWELMQDYIAIGLQDVCRSLMYLLKSDRVDVADKQNFLALYHRTANCSVMGRALPMLCRMMYAYHGRKIVLLIDEYDAPIQYAWSHGFYPEAIDFFRGFLSSALKSNPCLDFAVLTGVLRVAKESIFSGLNNFKVSSVLSGGFPDACGYTKEEMANMVRALGREDKLGELAAWYDGYDFQGMEIYNPWSVNNYFAEHCEPGAYWVNTSSNSIFPKILSQADPASWEDLRSLLLGGTVTMRLRESIIYNEIGKNSNDIYSLLLQTGYLKAVKTIRTSGGSSLYELAIPNKEIRLLYQTEILNRVDYSYGEVSSDDAIKEEIQEESSCEDDAKKKF